MECHCWYLAQINTSFNTLQILLFLLLFHTHKHHEQTSNTDKNVYLTTCCTSKDLVVLISRFYRFLSRPPPKVPTIRPLFHRICGVVVARHPPAPVSLSRVESRVVFREILLPHHWSQPKTSQVFVIRRCLCGTSANILAAFAPIVGTLRVFFFFLISSHILTNGRDLAYASQKQSESFRDVLIADIFATWPSWNL